MTVEEQEDVAGAVADEPEELYAGLRMLTVDDERTYVETYKKYFSKRGFEVFTANTVAEFEEHLKARHHHVILVDYYLDNDKVDGDPLMQLVEENDRDASVIVVTGRPSLDTASSAFDSGRSITSASRSKSMNWPKRSIALSTRRAFFGRRRTRCIAGSANNPHRAKKTIADADAAGAANRTVGRVSQSDRTRQEQRRGRNALPHRQALGIDVQGFALGWSVVSASVH